jgi:hypothetical protein
MDNRQNWTVVAEECEALAVAAKAQINRDMLLAAAARWRRMAKVARELDKVTNLDHAPLA